jgi:hypothetical protein
VLGSPIWQVDGYNASVYTDAALTSPRITVPAGATIQRVVFHMAVAGVAVSTNDGAERDIQGLFLRNNMFVKHHGDVFQQIHEEYSIIPVSTSAFFDSGAIPGIQQNRFHYGLYQAGDRELGCNLKVSYGGPTETSDMLVYADIALYQLGTNHGAPFRVDVVVYMRVLYYG